jgi:hypothetical protein
MPIIQVEHLTKEYRLGAMQGLKQTLLNSAACLTGIDMSQQAEHISIYRAETQEVVTFCGHLAKKGQRVVWLCDDIVMETAHA